MATDIAKYVADVQKYTAKVDEAAVAGVVRHCGIALRSRDASLVSASDPEEVKRVAEKFLKKKLELTDSDDKLIAAVKAVLDKMKADNSKSRVTVYYLLAEHYKKLAAFHPKG